MSAAATMGLTLVYLYAFWAAYVLAMGICRAWLSGRLKGMNYILGLPCLIIGLVMDILANLLIAPVIFADLPHEWLVTQRLIRYKNSGSGWRYDIACFICDGMLDPFDPTGNHC